MNNYIQILIGGQQRGLKFNNAAVDCYWQKVNFNEAETSSIYATFYAGLIGNDIAKGVQHSEFKYEEVTDWVDELSLQDHNPIKQVCDLFAETAFYKKRLENIQEKVRSLSEVEDPEANKKKVKK